MMVIVTVGCPGAAAVTTTLAVRVGLEPPGPVQVNVYVTVPTVPRGPTTVAALDVPTVPLHPSEPVPPPAVQEVAPLVDQARVVV